LFGEKGTEVDIYIQAFEEDRKGFCTIDYGSGALKSLGGEEPCSP
jgi:hypothetical protein